MNYFTNGAPQITPVSRMSPSFRYIVYATLQFCLQINCFFCSFSCNSSCCSSCFQSFLVDLLLIHRHLHCNSVSCGEELERDRDRDRDRDRECHTCFCNLRTDTHTHRQRQRETHKDLLSSYLFLQSEKLQKQKKNDD